VTGVTWAGAADSVGCMPADLSSPAAYLRERRDEAFCYLTTTGRVSGDPHRIEIWFYEHGGALYLLSGGGDGSDWVRNLRRHPLATLRLGDREGPMTARVVDDPDESVQAIARAGLREKYEPDYRGSLARWAEESLLVELTPTNPW
jgi:deazaflavin-dependent oxidoreductase (nitroreductase family)